MKTCTKCHIEKLESEFHRSRHHGGGIYPSCKSCVAAANKSLRDSFTPERRSLLNERARDRYNGVFHPRILIDEKQKYRERQQYLRDIKSSRGCLRCGESDPYALDFHHVGEKSFEISNGKKLSESRLGKEISKCVVLCANCHRKLHAERWTLLDFSAKIESDYPEAFDVLCESVHPHH